MCNLVSPEPALLAINTILMGGVCSDWKEYLTVCVPMNYSIWLSTMSTGHFIVQIRGHRLEYQIKIIF